MVNSFDRRPSCHINFTSGGSLSHIFRRCLLRLTARNCIWKTYSKYMSHFFLSCLRYFKQNKKKTYPNMKVSIVELHFAWLPHSWHKPQIIASNKNLITSPTRKQQSRTYCNTLHASTVSKRCSKHA